jgi:quinol monooxygenase YgiN
MKLVKVLDQEGTKIVSDPTNQLILKELVNSEQSISQLAQKMGMPTLKLWRRMQKFAQAGLVEISRTEKVGNIEKKFYRSTATWFAPQQFFDFKPKNCNLQKAFDIYSDIQKSMMMQLSSFGDVPKDIDPVDFSTYANMQAFADFCQKPHMNQKIAELARQLEIFKKHSGL